MAGSNDPVLTWLRDLISTRGMNTAELARRAEIDKGRLRRVLGGSQPMFVDELMKISNALELSPADMGLPQLEESDLELGPDEASEPEPPPAPRAADPYGNHARQLFEVGFALGTTFYFASDIQLLGDSGMPEHVLDQYKGRGEVMVSLDAAFHQQNDPRIDDAGITLTLSFDALYDCTFPWRSIRRVVFDVDWDDLPEEKQEEPPPAPEGKGPHLRLVT